MQVQLINPDTIRIRHKGASNVTSAMRVLKELDELFKRHPEQQYVIVHNTEAMVGTNERYIKAILYFVYRHREAIVGQVVYSGRALVRSIFRTYGLLYRLRLDVCGTKEAAINKVGNLRILIEKYDTSYMIVDRRNRPFSVPVMVPQYQ